jgi:lambda family phage minor tail protein L
MGQGQDKIASSLLDLQPTVVLEFFRLYPDTLNKPNTFIPIHGGSNFKKNVIWQGVQYVPTPIESEGFEINANGQLPRPKIRIANKGFLITSLLQNNYDFKNAKIVRKRTFIKYLDDVNFDGGNPFGQADSTAEISNEEFLIGQKISENKVYVEFELTSPLDLDNFEVNSRKILAKYCYWQYRGCGCNYDSLPIEQENGKPFLDADEFGIQLLNNNGSSNILDFTNSPSYKWDSTQVYQKGRMSYIENPNNLINYENDETRPAKTWYVSIIDNSGQNPESNPTYWLKDGCSKKISACKKRFNAEYSVEVTISTENNSSSYISVSGGKANSNTGKFYTVNNDIINSGLMTNYSLAGWTYIDDSTNGAGIFQTNSSKRYDGIRLYGLKGEYNLDYTFGMDQTAGKNSTIAWVNGLNFYSLNVERPLSSPHNYVRYSNDFSNGYWVKNNSPIITSDNVTAPNGLQEADLISVPMNASLNPGLSISNFQTNLKTDLGCANPISSYNQNLTFSIYIKPVDCPNFYVRFKINNGSTDFTEIINFNTVSKAITAFTYKAVSKSNSVAPASNALDNFNAGIYTYPTSGPYAGWLRLWCSVDQLHGSTDKKNSNTDKISITDINFGPTKDTLTYPTNAVGSYVYNVKTSSTTAATAYIWGAQVECIGLNPSPFYKTLSAAYKHPNFNLDGLDSIVFKINNSKQSFYSETSKNKSQKLETSNSEFSLGINQGFDKNNYSLNGKFLNWALWGRNLTADEISYLYNGNTVSAPDYAKANDFPAYPVQYDNCTGLYGGITGNSLISWWNTTISDRNKIENYHSGKNPNYMGDYSLSVSGTASEGDLLYTASVNKVITKTVGTTGIRFGGFPGTDGFAYG